MMRVCTLFLDEKEVYIVSHLGTPDVSYPFCAPMRKLSHEVSDGELGNAVIECVQESRKRTLEEAGDHKKEFLKFVGYTSPRALFRECVWMRARLEQDEIKISPIVESPKGDVAALIEQERRVPRNCEEALGRLVKRLFGHCRLRDGRRRFLHRDPAEQERLASLLDDLERVGFYRFSEPGEREESRRYSAATAFLYPAETKRCAHAGSLPFEELILQPLIDNSLRPMLKRAISKCARLKVVREPDCTVTVGKATHVLARRAEIAGGEHAELVRRRLYAVLNGVLEKSGVEERLYQLFDGTRLCFLLLTPEMFEMILASPDLPAEEKPTQVET